MGSEVRPDKENENDEQRFPMFIQLNKGNRAGKFFSDTLPVLLSRKGSMVYFTSLIFPTFSEAENRKILHPYFLILSVFPFNRTASFWMDPESNLNRYPASWFHSIPLDAYFSLHRPPLSFYPHPSSIVRSVLLDEYQFFRLEPPLLCLADQI